MAREHQYSEIYPVTVDVLKGILKDKPGRKPETCLDLDSIREESPFLAFCLTSKSSNSPAYLQGAECTFCALRSALQDDGWRIMILEGQRAIDRVGGNIKTLKSAHLIDKALVLTRYFPAECFPPSGRNFGQKFYLGAAEVLACIYNRGVITSVPEPKNGLPNILHPLLGLLKLG